MEIFFVRHGQTQANADNLYYDNHEKNEYYPINEKGIDESITPLYI
jgi:broad specificity phosphatase PhoE